VSEGKWTIPAAKVKVITVNMGTSVSGLSNCPFNEMSTAADLKAVAMGVDPGSYTYES
jgi:hypothetical protein